MEHVIELEDITAAYDRQPVLWDLDLNIPKGSLMGIVGPNGAGKSTLLKIILNLLAPVSGRIRFSIDGETDAKKARRKIAYVPQNGSVNWDFPATVKDIVLMGRYGHIGWCRPPSQGDRLIAEEMIARVGMDSYEDRQINELSGGQQQRVLLARAMCATKKLLLLDEPVTGLDPVAANEMYNLIKLVNLCDNTSVIMISHDIHAAVRYATHILHLGHSQLFFGTTAQYRESDLARRFVGGERA